MRLGSDLGGEADYWSRSPRGAMLVTSFCPDVKVGIPLP